MPVAPFPGLAPHHRFISVNIPNLHYIEDEWAFEAGDRFRLPTEFEIRDALGSVRQLGAGVVRIYALSVKKRTDPEGRPRHVLAPGAFDERAFVALDRVLQVAGELGVRVILPFVDNWHWWGGVAEYAAFHGLPAPAFWTDERVIADFERTVDFVLNRKNTLTGRLYRDDPAVYAWETGNELQAPYAWTARIAAYIKGRDRTHAVIDGYHSDTVRDEAINDPNIDLLTTHHYATSADTVSAIARNVARIAGKKPYFVGEFGLLQPADIERVLNAVLERNVLGALIWSLRSHREEGGFYWHAERDVYESYRWPGFASGDPYGERTVLALLKRSGYRARGEAEQPMVAPAAPTLLPIASPAAISWQGSIGASSYSVERTTSADPTWVEVARDISDARTPYRALWSDPSAAVGTTYHYRVVAHNAAGVSLPSNAVGPVEPTVLTWIDELEDNRQAHSFSAGVELVRSEPVQFRMDRHRARGSADDFITYQLPGAVEQLRLYAFETGTPAPLVIESSGEAGTYTRLAASRTDHQFKDASEPFHPIAYRATAPPGVTRLRIRLGRDVQLGRVEIDYRPPTTR